MQHIALLIGFLLGRSGGLFAGVLTALVAVTGISGIAGIIVTAIGIAGVVVGVGLLFCYATILFQEKIR